MNDRQSSTNNPINMIQNKTILTGVKATGDGLHIGNYFGAIKPLLEIAPGNTTYLMLPDLHSLTSVHSAETLQRNKKNVFLQYVSFFPKDCEIIIFEQSALARHNDIVWILNSVTPYSLMLRAHAFKDSQAKNSEINMAVFNYPILMAADILNFDAHYVPVGKDQKQHIEFARDIAGNFHKTYNCEIFTLPEALISEEVAVIPGTDWRKMSKSYDNFIGIFDNEKILKKKIASIVTDTTPLEEPKNPETCNVYALIKLLASKEEAQNIAQKYREWWYGYGHAKKDLERIFLEFFSDAREKYAHFQKDDTQVIQRIEHWNALAQAIVTKKYEAVAKIAGLL